MTDILDNSPAPPVRNRMIDPGDIFPKATCNASVANAIESSKNWSRKNDQNHHRERGISQDR